MAVAHYYRLQATSVAATCIWQPCTGAAIVATCARAHTHTLTLSRRRLLIKSELRPWTMVLAAAEATAFFALSFACIELADGLDITPIVFICSYCS